MSSRTAGPRSRFPVPTGAEPGTAARELGSPPASPARRPQLIRWRGLVPATLILAGIAAGWALFGERVVGDTVEEAGTKALGAQLDIADVEISERRATVELRGLTLADPFNANRNLVEASVIRVELEPEPLLERKIVIRQLTVRGVRTGTPRATPARPVAAGGFAPRALAELDRWSKQFRVPLLSLTPIDTIKSLVLDPAQLRSVREAQAVGARADSVKRALEDAYAALRLRETLDTARAVAARLQGASLSTLGLVGVRNAVADARRAIVAVDSAKRRVEALERTARTALDTLQGGLRGLDDARRADYEFARGLLALPSFDAPQIGAALFAPVTIQKFEQALYWTTLARQYAPPGLLPRQSSGPKRLRRPGHTVHFVKREAYPRFHVRRADVDFALESTGAGRGAYTLAAVDATTEPAIVGRPARFALRREASGSAVESLRATAVVDHLGPRPRDVISAQASGVRLPAFALPVLPLRAQPGRGTSELHLALDGDRVSARWALRSGELDWLTDSARTRSLNQVESLITRVITGVREFDLTAELNGPVSSPALAVRSNLDRAVATRLREIAGAEAERALAKARAHVDRIVEEKAAPVRARVSELRTDAERRLAEAKGRLDEEKQKLEVRVKSLTPRI